MEELDLLHDQDVFQMRQGTKMRDWLYVPPSKVNRMELGDQEWRNALFF